MSTSPEAARKVYVDFELEVGREQVRAQCSLAGEARAPFVLPLDQAERTQLRRWLERAIGAARGLGGVPAASLQMDDPERIGTKLFDALFTERIRSLYDRSRAVAGERGMAGLRLKLRLLDEVESLPWELLHDSRDDYLALSPGLTLVRYLEAPVPIRPIGIEGPLRVLLVGGAPDGLDLPKEIHNVREALKEVIDSGRVTLDVIEQATLDNIYNAVRSIPFHVFHYMGHSTPPTKDVSAQLLLADGAGGSLAVEIDGLWRTLRRAQALRLVWLNSCSSAFGQDGALVGPLASAAARFVMIGVPAVLANQLRISDRAALRLAGSFYTNLAQGMPVDLALAEARVEVSINNLKTLEWATPVLYMRAPDGVLFQVAVSAGASQAGNQPQNTGGDTITVGNITGSSGIAIGRNTSANASTHPSPSTPASEEEELSQLLTQQLRALKRRLNQRELQRAQYGISADPSVIIEIEDLTKEIAKLEARIAGKS